MFPLKTYSRATTWMFLHEINIIIIAKWKQKRKEKILFKRKELKLHIKFASLCHLTFLLWLFCYKNTYFSQLYKNFTSAACCRILKILQVSKYYKIAYRFDEFEQIYNSRIKKIISGTICFECIHHRFEKFFHFDEPIVKFIFQAYHSPQES